MLCSPRRKERRMFQQRHSCDRCRQHKVRCLKNWELQAAGGGGGEHHGPCERCAKADAPCVYSLRQKNRQGSHHLRGREANPISPRRNTQFSQDLTGLLSGSDVTTSDLGDLTIPLLDTTTCMPTFDDNDSYDWNNNPNFTYNGDYDPGTQEDTLTEQLLSLSIRTTRAARQLESTGSTAPLTVNSPVVNEAFEAANALVRVVNSVPLSNHTYTSSQPLAREETERQQNIDYGLVFLALTFHQHVLALFRAICDSIRRSLGSIGPISEQQRQALHGNGASSAQFVMVLQLVMHMINRLDRSLRVGSRDSSRSVAVIHPHNLTFGLEGREGGNSQSVVGLAQEILRALPDEHEKIKQAIQGLQTRMEESI